jgi:hypothetical protein
LIVKEKYGRNRSIWGAGRIQKISSQKISSNMGVPVKYRQIGHPKWEIRQIPNKILTYNKTMKQTKHGPITGRHYNKEK